MCIYCNKMCSKLTNHIKNKHKDLRQVKKILGMKRSSRIKEFEKLKRLGIIEFNKREARKEQPDYQGEKKGKVHKDMVLCSNCSSFISRRFFSNHKRRCSLKLDAPSVAIPMFEHSLLEASKFSEDFSKK